MRYNIAATWAALMGVLTLFAEQLTAISANPVIGPAQMAVDTLLAPGLLVAAMVGSLIPGALVNGAVHFGLCWFVLRFFHLKPEPREWRAGDKYEERD